MWICTDPEAANLHCRHDRQFDSITITPADGSEPGQQGEQEDVQEARRAERRRVIDNN